MVVQVRNEFRTGLNEKKDLPKNVRKVTGYKCSKELKAIFLGQNEEIQEMHKTCQALNVVLSGPNGLEKKFMVGLFKLKSIFKSRHKKQFSA